MEEKVQVSTNLSLTFEGQRSIDADLLMESLGGAIKAYKASLSAIYDGQGAEIGINIKAFAPGSVDVLLESVVGLAPAFLPYVPSAIESTKCFLEIVKLKKELKGKKPLSLENLGEKTKIINHAGDTTYHDSKVTNIFINNPVIDSGLIKMFGVLDESDRPAVSLKLPDETVQIEKDDYHEMCCPVVAELQDIDSQKIETEVNAQLLLKSSDFIGSSKWSFYYDTKLIHASIADELFMQKFKKGEIKLCAGVRFPVRMRIEAYFDKKLEPVRREYLILEVTGDLIDPTDAETQLMIDDFEITEEKL